MSILMTGGGTGGHLAIIKAVKEKLGEEELIYVGSTKGQDKQWFEKDDDFKAKYFFKTRGVVNQGRFGKIKSLWMVAKATIRGIFLIKKHKVKVVFSVGGFSSAPMAFASKLTFTPLVIHEQNASLGSLNRLLKPYATYFISSYLKESPIQAYPIKKVFFDNAHIRKELKTIIFLGGSQGAKAINSLALELAPTLKAKNINIIHQAGQNNIKEIKMMYKALDIEAEVFGFTSTLDEYMNRADFAIARSGASTLWELSASGIPSLFIPYPYASSNHQFFNAEFFVEQKVAWIIDEDKINIKNIIPFFDEVLEEKSKRLLEIVQPNGTKEIASLLTQI